MHCVDRRAMSATPASHPYLFSYARLVTTPEIVLSCLSGKSDPMEEDFDYAAKFNSRPRGGQERPDGPD